MNKTLKPECAIRELIWYPDVQGHAALFVTLNSLPRTCRKIGMRMHCASKKNKNTSCVNMTIQYIRFSDSKREELLKIFRGVDIEEHSPFRIEGVKDLRQNLQEVVFRIESFDL